ncbi:hypothetical protein CR513_34807, partial [Mucuna pruriens]
MLAELKGLLEKLADSSELINVDNAILLMRLLIDELVDLVIEHRLCFLLKPNPIPAVKLLPDPAHLPVKLECLSFT